MQIAETTTTDVTTSPAPAARTPALVNHRRFASEVWTGNQTTLRRLSRTTPHLQCKVEIGAVNDPLEAEADRVADQVLRMPDPAISSTDAPQPLRRKCTACEEEDEKLQRKETAAGPAVAPPVVQESNLQYKLEVGAVNDPLEAEAHRVADQVMRRSDPSVSIATASPQISCKCASCEEEEDKKLKAKLSGAPLAGETPSIVHDVLRSPGQPLDGPTRSLLEPRFGADFADVRLHTDASAAESAQAVGALAYTVGNDLVFAPGAYAPASDAGQRLLAHELTHVLQNGHGVAATLRRETPPDIGAAPTDAGTGPTQAQQTTCPQVTPVCPAEYCKPFSSQQEAEQDRAKNGEGILGDIKLLNSRAEPLFRQFVFDPAPAGDISSTVANDFTNCAVSRETTQALLQKLQAALQANPPAFPPDGGSVTLNITAVISAMELATFMCRMVFDDYTSVPGLIAGGVGETQESEKIGKNTSGAVNDSRAAAGTLTVSRTSDGSLDIIPNITYTVVDTLDFCPGNCGGSGAQRLTIPLSQWEASSISGDVPFQVVFPAPSLVGAFDSEEG